MPSVIFSGTKVKALKSTLNLNDGADVISSTVDPTSVATAGNPGSLLLNTSSGKAYKKLDSGSSTNWANLGTSNIVSKTTTYSASINDDIILCSGSAFTVTLPAASSMSGRTMVIKKTDSSLSNIITVDGNGAETIDGSATTTLNTLNETLTLVCDGSSWQILNRRIPLEESTLNVTLTNFGNATVSANKYTRDGSYIYGRARITIGSTLPSGGDLRVNLSDVTLVSSSGVIIGTAIAYTGGATNGHIGAVYGSTTTSLNFWGGDGDVGWNATIPATFAAGDLIDFNFSAPVSGWGG